MSKEKKSKSSAALVLVSIIIILIAIIVLLFKYDGFGLFGLQGGKNSVSDDNSGANDATAAMATIPVQDDQHPSNINSTDTVSSTDNIEKLIVTISDDSIKLNDSVVSDVESLKAEILKYDKNTVEIVLRDDRALKKTYEDVESMLNGLASQGFTYYEEN